MNIAQKVAIEATDPVLLCVAGPGSGKTTTMIDRIVRQIRDGAKGLVIITFTTAAAAEMRHRLQTRGVTVGSRGPISYLGTIHGYALRILRAHPGAYFHAPPTVMSETERELRIRAAMAEGRGKGLTLEQVEAAIAENPVAFPGVVTRKADFPAIHYLTRCRADGLVDFDSMVSWATATAIKVRLPSLPLFVDEVQDCSDSDFRFLRALTPSSVFMVGDPDQSIFGFRGGRPDLMMAVEATRLPPMEINYRCKALICVAANAIIRESRRRFIQKETKPDSSFTGGTVRAIRPADQAEELEEIAEWARARRACSRAILCRTNFGVKQVGEALEKKGVPVRIYTSEDANVEGWDAAIEVVSLAAEPENEAAAHTICRRINPGALVSVVSSARVAGKALPEYLLGIRPADLRVAPTYDTLPRALTHKAGVHQESVRRAMELLDRLPSETSWQDLLTAMASGGGVRSVRGPKDGVPVMTIHRAKGQEWDEVWLPGWSAAAFPEPRSDWDEEVRLAFVAVTRARDSLTISAPAAGRFSPAAEKDVEADESRLYTAVVKSLYGDL